MHILVLLSSFASFLYVAIRFAYNPELVQAVDESDFVMTILCAVLVAGLMISSAQQQYSSRL